MSIIHKLFLLFAVVLLALGSAAHSPADTEQYHLYIGPSSRTFLVHIPKKLTHSQRAPLVIALHGGGTNGKWMEDFSGLSGAAEQYGFVVVYPNGSGRFRQVLTWNAGNYLKVIKVSGGHNL